VESSEESSEVSESSVYSEDESEDQGSLEEEEEETRMNLADLEMDTHRFTEIPEAHDSGVGIVNLFLDAADTNPRILQTLANNNVTRKRKVDLIMQSVEAPPKKVQKTEAEAAIYASGIPPVVVSPSLSLRPLPN
jgi:hypothetical protein